MDPLFFLFLEILIILDYGLNKGCYGSNVKKKQYIDKEVVFQSQKSDWPAKIKNLFCSFFLN